MFITTDPSRLLDLIPIIRPGDTANVSIPQFKVKVDIIIKEISAAGLSGTMAENRNRTFTHYHGNKYWNGSDKEVFDIEWSKVERIYMKGN